MKRFISFGSIEQMRTIIGKVKHSAQYVGYDEENKMPIMDRNAELPVVNATCSEKVHGSNFSVCYSNPDGFWTQSRKNIITPLKDNAGSAFIAESNKDAWMEIIYKLAKEYDINLDNKIITVYSEWAGGNIQSNSCLSGLDKRAMIFQHFKVSPIVRDEDNPESSVWYETKVDGKWVDNPEKDIFNVMNFPTWEIEIDFNKPDIANNKLVDLIENTIEPNSPIGKQFGKEGNTGEGVVCTFTYKDVLYRFKVKGSKHSKTKVKKLKKVDSVKEQAKREFANYATPAWRLEQMYQELYGINNEKGEPNIKDTGDFIKLVIKDVMKEEMDVMYKKGLTPKEVNSLISRISANWFKEQLDKYVGL